MSVAIGYHAGQVPPGGPGSGVPALESRSSHVHVLPHGALRRGEEEGRGPRGGPGGEAGVCWGRRKCCLLLSVTGRPFQLCTTSIGNQLIELLQASEFGIVAVQPVD